jgi:CheY-like chemotaxis protein
MKKILIVDDNPDLRDLLSVFIRGLGHEVAIAITGEEAVERASAMKPDLILMDIGLPKFNGVEATIQIKASPTTKDIPVVILSAFPMSRHGRHAIEAGAVEILQKPFRVSDLEQVLMKYRSKSTA